MALIDITYNNTFYYNKWYDNRNFICNHWYYNKAINNNCFRFKKIKLLN